LDSWFINPHFTYTHRARFFNMSQKSMALDFATISRRKTRLHAHGTIIYSFNCPRIIDLWFHLREILHSSSRAVASARIMLWMTVYTDRVIAYTNVWFYMNWSFVLPQNIQVILRSMFIHTHTHTDTHTRVYTHVCMYNCVYCKYISLYWAVQLVQNFIC
jgi:hypothetical protein